jgi:hypothetical protein
VRFKFKDSIPEQSYQMGVIAQEVETVFPELVETGPDNMKAVNYSGLTAVLIEAVKEQQAQISRLLTQCQ